MRELFEHKHMYGYDNRDNLSIFSLLFRNAATLNEHLVGQSACHVILTKQYTIYIYKTLVIFRHDGSVILMFLPINF